MSEEAGWSVHLRPSLAELRRYEVSLAQPRARLHANECPEPWPAAVMVEMAGLLQEVELGRYPDLAPERLRRLFAARYGVGPERVVLGDGSDEVIAMLLTALAGPTGRPSRVLVPDPSFVMYEHSARALGLEVHRVPLTAALELDPGAMRAALAALAPALCFLARPNNPTSSLWDAGLILALVAEFPATVFVIDEAYIAYAPGASLWASDRPANFVLMGTLSKVGLAALRVGFCVAHPALVDALERVRHPYNVPGPSAVLAEAALTRFHAAQEGMIARTIAGRSRLLEIMKKRLPGAFVFPAFANLVVVRLDPPAAAPRLTAALAERGILIKDLSRLTRLAGCVRVSVGTAAELDLLDEALGALAPGVLG
ncbi:MAG: aminotransferase class I/II-fold pyridoxal phosphate-dependent enzyme [Nannocystis sp.]|nr:aminotransferase class I/II-fold pyridoxal phosphate-dependent enzyme [Nannocystis sp.]